MKRHAPPRRSRPLLLWGAALVLVVLTVACAPAAGSEPVGEGVRDFGARPLPRAERWVVAAPEFAVRSGSLRIGGEDVAGRSEAEGIHGELGAGVSDIFVTEAVRSQRFVVTERAELARVLQEQELGRSGLVDPASAAAVGRITGAELIVLGSVTEFGVTTTGGGGRVFGVFGGTAETVTARVGVDLRMVDAATAEVIAIGVGTAEASQSNVRIDVFNVIRGLGAGRTGTTIIDVAVRNAIRSAIDEAASALPSKGNA